ASGGLVPIQGVFNYAAAGATLTMPLRNRNEGEIAAAQATATGAAATLEAAKLSARAGNAAATARSAQNRAAVARIEEAVRLARQNLDTVRQTYELGRMTVTDVLAEQRRFLDLERAHTGALRETYDAEASLRNSRGERP